MATMTFTSTEIVSYPSAQCMIDALDLRKPETPAERRTKAGILRASRAGLRFAVWSSALGINSGSLHILEAVGVVPR